MIGLAGPDLAPKQGVVVVGVNSAFFAIVSCFLVCRLGSSPRQHRSSASPLRLTPERLQSAPVGFRQRLRRFLLGGDSGLAV